MGCYKIFLQLVFAFSLSVIGNTFLFSEGAPDVGVSEAFNVAVSPDDRLFATGYYRVKAGEPMRPYLWCYTDSGYLDKSFNNTGYIDFFKEVPGAERFELNGMGIKVIIDEGGMIHLAGISEYKESFLRRKVVKSFFFQIPYPYTKRIDVLEDTQINEFVPDFSRRLTALTIDRLNTVHFLQLSGMTGLNVQYSIPSSTITWINDGELIQENGIDVELLLTGCAVGNDGRQYIICDSRNKEGVHEENKMIVLCLDRNGHPEEDFNGTGFVELADSGNSFSVAVDSNGKILICGRTDGWNAAIWRLLPDGRLDHLFGLQGCCRIPSVFDDDDCNCSWSRSLAFDNEGSIYVLTTKGCFEYETEIWKLNQSGEIDENYGNGGYASTSQTAGGNRDYGISITIDSEGRAIICGSSKTDYYVSTDHGGSHGRIMTLWRFNKEGQPDLTFNDSGHLLIHTEALESR